MTKRVEGVEMLTDEDLLTQVLSRLPVKDLLQCKAVSKAWYSLISNPNFIKSHYQRAAAINSNDNNEDAIIIVRLFKTEPKYYPEEDGSYALIQLGDCDDYIANLKFPFSRGDYPVTPPSLFVGCVRGIVCVCVDPCASIEDSHCFPACDKATDIYIWNPATRQSKLIPPNTLYDCDGPSTTDDTSNYVALGFGFDPVDFDFKVVRVVYRSIFPEVYSVNRDAWRTTEAKLMDVPDNCRFQICLHGFLFAMGRNGMMAFDLNKELFICDIELPINSNGDREHDDARVADFKDSVAVIISNDQELSGKINLWTLDDEACLCGGRVKASWTFMFSIDVGVDFEYVQGLYSSVEFLLVDVDEWLSYNSDKKEVRTIETDPFFDFDAVFKYTESQQMLLVTNSKLVSWSDDEEDFCEESSIHSESACKDFIVISEDDNEESNSEDDNEEISRDSEDDCGGERLTDEDLLTEVLSRLPVKYLLRCKAVSKAWYSLISNPSFIKSHYQRVAINTTPDSTGDDNDETPILIVRLYKTEDPNYYPEEDGSYSLFRLVEPEDYIAHLDFPFSGDDYPFTPPSLLVGCVCGIVCVCVDPSAPIYTTRCVPTCDKATDIYLWNPATRQSKLIPSHALYDCGDTNRVALGFGFDPVDFDFKVVRVVSRTIFPEVYSANRDAWRTIGTKLIDIPYNCRFDICLHGFLFATGYSGMMAFNLNKEVFICDIKLPINFNGPRKCYDARIVDFKDSIAVIFSNDKELRGKINLWRLDDEACLRGGGVEASWTFMLNIDVGKGFDHLQGLINSVEFLLIDGQWNSYNSDKKAVRCIETYLFFDFEEVFKYTESQQMLLVAGSKLVYWSDDEDVESSVDLEDDDACLCCGR